MSPMALAYDSGDRSAPEPWLQDPWDWESARVNGKLHRFGYRGDRVLVLVVALHEPAHPQRR